MYSIHTYAYVIKICPAYHANVFIVGSTIAVTTEPSEVPHIYDLMRKIAVNSAQHATTTYQAISSITEETSSKKLVEKGLIYWRQTIEVSITQSTT